MKYCDRGLFYSPVYFGLCLSEKKFRKELKRLNIPKHKYPDFLRNGAFANVHTLVKDSINDLAKWHTQFVRPI